MKQFISDVPTHIEDDILDHFIQNRIAEDIPDGKVANAFWHTYSTAEYSSSISKLICLFFYLLGSVLIGIVIIQNCIFVFNYFITYNSFW